MALALDCCDYEAMSSVATTGGYSGYVVRDVMLARGFRRRTESSTQVFDGVRGYGGESSHLDVARLQLPTAKPSRPQKWLSGGAAERPRLHERVAEIVAHRVHRRA